jgi:hypothetical protein
MKDLQARFETIKNKLIQFGYGIDTIDGALMFFIEHGFYFEIKQLKDSSRWLATNRGYDNELHTIIVRKSEFHVKIILLEELLNMYTTSLSDIGFKF